ncbi:MAG: S46 family peptidase [Vicingaceae bacterium]
MKKIIVFIGVLFIGSIQLSAKEGMCIPLLLEKLNESEMQTMGFKLTAEDVYSANKSSMKDAVVSFGGFCTAELISPEGLLLTNHHCGYGSIQNHSTVENDYLTDGFWAMSKEEELPNPGLTATFIVRIEEVTDQILGDVDEMMTEVERQKIINENIKKVGEKAIEGTHYNYVIKPFFYGNQYFMFITETFLDVRLVGAPPSAIGKFGGDTDNWVYPRHTGDFSLFRIYADKDNKPAAYSKDNVPYKPKHYFPISLKGFKEGDFTMVYGFPGRTQQYLTSYAVDFIQNKSNPKKIAIREEILKIMNKHMKENDKVRIQYASKYASISNYHKKWIGENQGLIAYEAIKKKQKQESLFQEKVNDNDEYFNILNELKKNYDAVEDAALARDYFIEIIIRGIEITSFPNRISTVINKLKNGETVEEKEFEKLKNIVKSHFKNYDVATDKELFEALMVKYIQLTPEKYLPADLVGYKTDTKTKVKKLADKIYSKSVLVNESKSNSVLNDLKKNYKTILKDPAYKLAAQIYAAYFDFIIPEYETYNNNIELLNRKYVKGLMEFIPDAYYPDANSTLRVAYGNIKSAQPRDAITYSIYTTLDGMIEKNLTGNPDYELPEKLKDLYEKKDYGQYAVNGTVPVCFIATNHTTGGNSGSPVINANGELLGCNFDRQWEGTMSDIMFDESRCRNITCDIRFVLFVIDKYAGAGYLLNEMKLIK